MRCFLVAGFLLTSASRGPSAIAEPLVIIVGLCVLSSALFVFIFMTMSVVDLPFRQ